MNVSDLKINSCVRSVLSRHYVDLQRLSYASFRGTVRLQGELAHLSARSSAIDLGQIEKIDQEIRRIPGVVRVNFDLENVQKSESGKWELVRKTSTMLIQ